MNLVLALPVKNLAPAISNYSSFSGDLWQTQSQLEWSPQK